MTSCAYAMEPRVRVGTGWARFPVWKCALDEGHGGEHSPGSMNYGKRQEIKTAYAMKGKESATKKPRVAPGIEVPLDMVVKRTKTGAINTQSTLGKVVALALDAGCEVKAGRSEAVAWIQGAHHGLRFSVCGTTVVVNGRSVPKEELFVRLEEIK